jgi:hypothetical protein
LLKQRQIRGRFDPAANRLAVEHSIGLCPRCANGRAFAGVEGAKLNAGLIGRDGHRATEGIDFLDQVPFANPADRRVAGHLPEGFDVVGQQQRRPSSARGGQRSLGACMATADNDDIETTRVLHQIGTVRAQSRFYRARLHSRLCHAGHRLDCFT